MLCTRHLGRPSLSVYSGADRILQVSSSWTWTSCKLKTQWWIRSTVCYNSAKNSCHYGALSTTIISP
jgi:hypothetical protein